MINREIIYERNMTGSYMKIPEGMNPGLDERLMLKGKLKGALSVEKTYMDGCGQYWYNISGKQSLDTYCRVKQIGMEFVERLVVSVCSELEILEWNLIHTNCLMLDPELVFITNSSREFIFTLYPGNNTQIETEFQQLMEYLLTKIDHKDEAAVRAAYGIYEKTLEDGYSVTDIREYILQSRQQEADRSVAAPVKKEAPPLRKPPEEGTYCGRMQKEAGQSPADRAQKPLRTTKTVSEATGGKSGTDGGFFRKTWEYIRRQLGYSGNVSVRNILKQRGKPQMGFSGRTAGERRKRQEEPPVVYPEEEIVVPQEEIFPTVCLSGYRGVPRGVLLYQGAEQLADIPLGAKVVKIGHGPEADVRIDRDTISQLHARIDRDGDNYYIEDLNSTNGTCVNEEALVYKERRQLKINDIVQFADVRYRFY